MSAGRVLVIGAAGLVGRHVHAALAGRDVAATSHREAFEGALPLDVVDAAAVRRIVERVRPDAIVLAAARPYVEECERDPAGTRRVNVEAATFVRDAAYDVGAALVVFSSEYVFDGTAGTYGEEDPVDPLNEYGRQKVALEAIARALPRGLVLRVSGVFGADPARKSFVWQLVDRLRQGRSFDVPSDQLITPTDARSLGRAVVDLLDRGATGTLHAAGPEILERIEFARRICAAFGLPTELLRARPTAELGLQAPRPRRAGLRDDKLRATLGRPLARCADALALLTP